MTMPRVWRIIGAILVPFLFSSIGRAQEPALEHSDVEPDSNTVGYSAETIDYDFETKTVLLLGKAEIKYRDMVLSAERITFNTETDMIHAEGVPDTISGGEKMIGTPIFRDDGEELRGLEMSYNLRTGKGAVLHGSTELEKGFYRGREMRKVAEKTAYVGGGSFTTCDKEEPHYDFYSSRMKILQDDKVIAKPIVLRIARIPVLWFPFYIFPIKKERHSGILVPRWGSNSLDGLNFRNVGYYFAPSDYWDATLRGSLREKTGWLLETDFRYALRYTFQGSVDLAFENRRRDGQTTGREWRFGFQHTQTLSPTMTLRGSGRFMSNKDFSRENSDNLYDRLNRTLRSYFTLNKRWRESGRSVEVRFLHEKNLDTSRMTLSFPRITFRMPRKPLFQRQGESIRRPPGKDRSTKWYQSIYYSFNSSLANVMKQWPQSGGLQTRNTLEVDGRFNLSSQHKVLGWLNLTPSFNLSERWVSDEWKEYTRTDSYSGTVSTNTTIYGLFQPRIGSLKAVRHVVKPGTSFSYSRRAQEVGGFYSFGGKRDVSDPQRRLNLRLGNILQIKTEREGKERKFDLATLDFSTSYNFAGERKLSDLNTSFSIKPSRKLDLRLNSRHDFYGPGSLDLKSLSVTTSLRLTGRKGKMEKVAEPREPEGEFLRTRLGEPDILLEGSFDEDFLKDRQPWRLNLSHNYSFSKGGHKRSWIKGSFRFNPTKNWRVDYSLNYNLNPVPGEKRITAQSLSVYRDLHCWEARFSLTPSGFRRGYYFKINIKELPQIKFERKGGVRRF